MVLIKPGLDFILLQKGECFTQCTAASALAPLQLKIKAFIYSRAERPRKNWAIVFGVKEKERNLNRKLIVRCDNPIKALDLQI